MPTIQPQPQQQQGAQGGGGANAQRTTFRPPWVKEGPQPIPMPTSAPWTRAANRRDSQTGGSRPGSRPVSITDTPESPVIVPTASTNNSVPIGGPPPGEKEVQPAPVRKQSKITIIPSQPKENGVSQPPRPVAKPAAVTTPVAPDHKLRQDVITAASNKQQLQQAREQLEPVNQRQKLQKQLSTQQEPKPRERTVQITREEPKREEPKLKPVEVKRDEPKVKPVEVKREEPKLRPVEAKREEPKLRPVEAKREEPKLRPVEAKREEPKLRPVEAKREEPKLRPVEVKKEEPKLRPVEVKREEPKPRERPVEIKKEEPKPKERSVDLKKEEPKPKERTVQIARQESKPKEELKTRDKLQPVSKDTPQPKVARQESKTKDKMEQKKVEPPQPPTPPATSKGAPQPPAPPMPPPPPKLPRRDSKPISKEQAEKLEALRSRPRKRPDWGAMMKDIEMGKKLKHVQSNDRSSPLIPKIKVKDKFMYESEKPNVHNQLLRQIQTGVTLKRVQCNDRSRPQLDGLRKFRRQLTIEEQIQKAEEVAVTAEPDELDDIDKVRDDLQSTKQMLALELRNKEAVERENKRLQARVLNLEVELEKEKAKKQAEQTPQAKRTEEQEMVKKLKSELTEAQKANEDLETKYHDAAGQLDMTRAELEDVQRKNQILEKKLAALKENELSRPITKQPSSKKIAAMNQQAADKLNNKEEVEDEESEYEEVTETETEEESSDEGEDTEALRAKRNARELKLLATKLKNFKEKEMATRKERRALRDQLKKEQKALREEKHKYKLLQKEVDKMAKLMKEDDEEDEEEEDDEEEESETESESEESEEEESDGDLPPDAPDDKRKQNFTDRAKRHENILGALKKGNYLLKANIDKLKDDLFKQKEMSLTLQEDLNSVLAELG